MPMKTFSIPPLLRAETHLDSVSKLSTTFHLMLHHSRFPFQMVQEFWGLTHVRTNPFFGRFISFHFTWLGTTDWMIWMAQSGAAGLPTVAGGGHCLKMFEADRACFVQGISSSSLGERRKKSNGKNQNWAEE